MDYYNYNNDSLEKYQHWYSFLQSGSDEASSALKETQEKNDAEGYNKIKGAAFNNYLLGLTNSFSKGEVATAIEIAALYQNVADDENLSGPLEETLGIRLTTNKNDITEQLQTAGVEKATRVQGVYKLLDALDVYFMTTTGDYLGYPMSDERLDDLRNDFSLARQGIAKVPYDDYPTLLHEGEAVLTASTSNELSNMIDEYRDSELTYDSTTDALLVQTDLLTDIVSDYESVQTETAGLDAVIQSQTETLVAKLEEVVQAITSGMVASETTTNLTAENTYSNMLRMRSTKSL